MENVRAQLIELYMELTKECPINQLGPPYTFRYADETKANILATDVMDVDVKSAFPTICKILFGEDHPFVQNIFKMDDKLERNIYIATTLKQQSEKDGVPYLNELNLWSKILVLAYVYSHFNNISILEFVKDGTVIKAEKNGNISKPGKALDEFIKKYEIVFHKRKIDFYARVNKTSVIKYKDGKLKLKGNYNSPPQFVSDVLTEIFDGKTYDKKLLRMVKKVYDPVYYKILYKSGLREDIKTYYEFQDGRFLTSNGKMTNSFSEIEPTMYLTEIIYPVLSLIRLHHKN